MFKFYHFDLSAALQRYQKKSYCFTDVRRSWESVAHTTVTYFWFSSAVCHAWDSGNIVLQYTISLLTWETLALIHHTRGPQRSRSKAGCLPNLVRNSI